MSRQLSTRQLAHHSTGHARGAAQFDEFRCWKSPRHIAALEDALQFAASGQASCVAPAPDAAEYSEFQAMAEALLDAKQSGLVYEAKAERSRARETYGHIKQVIVAGWTYPKRKALIRAITDSAFRS